MEIDSAGGNFSNAASRTVTGELSTTYTAKELNEILLGYGFAFGIAKSMDVRLVSSYANNNEQLTSNILTIQMTPYVVPPKVMPPGSKTLFIIGSATAGGWGYNPVPVPAQQFTMLDSVTYKGTFFLKGGQEYLLLPNGNWDSKYAVEDNSIPDLNAGGDFGFNVGSSFNSNFPGPATTGMYDITVDFQNGKFIVSPAGSFGLLYVPGDYQGWDPGTAPALGSLADDGSYDGYVNIPAGGSYKFKFTTAPDWSNALGDGGGGTLVPGGGSDISLGAPGYYHLTANTNDNTWSATATSWSMIGSFAASSWSTDIDMTYSSSNNNWTGTITTADGDQFKFRANHDWGLNYGETNGTGRLSLNGDNIGDASKNYSLPAGTHTVTLFLNNSGYYTYLIQ